MKFESYIYIIGVMMLIGMCPVRSQERESHPHLTDSIGYMVEMQSSMCFDGERTPLWLNANKYGLSSIEKNNGYLRASVERPLGVDEGRRWGVGYCLDMVGAVHHNAKAFIQQAYAEGRWLRGTLTVGSKEYGMELKNQRLSTGSQTLGINARPVPQVRLSLDDYWSLPFTRGMVCLKGHIAYGRYTDDNWQKDFTGGKEKHTERVLYHSKAGYLRIGNVERFAPVTLELGLEMGAQFGGTSYRYIEGEEQVLHNQGGLKGIWDAFIPGGSEIIENDYTNVSGNQVGSWLARLNFDYDRWYLGIYADHFFEDHSGMFMMEYDGYGTGDEWDKKKKSRFLLYDLKDIMLGVDLRFKNSMLWINNILVEYIYTKYQSGPVYHDHTPLIPDHVGGLDKYYNHHIYTGWQHWGQVMGNPLYRSPQYNEDSKIMVENNRFVAWHLGIGGEPTDEISYRVLATWQKGWGTYTMPFRDPATSVNLMAEACYTFPNHGALNGWSVTAAAGLDHGKIYGNNVGLQLTISKKGLMK